MTLEELESVVSVNENCDFSIPDLEEYYWYTLPSAKYEGYDEGLLYFLAPLGIQFQIPLELIVKAYDSSVTKSKFVIYKN